MTDPTITRDILRAALDKAADNGDMQAFERVVTAMAGTTTAAQQQTTPEERELRPITAMVAARPLRTFTYGNAAKNAIRAVTPKRMRGDDAK